MSSEADLDLELEQYPAEVRDITKANKTAFDTWAANENSDTSEIPHEALNYLIPPELLALAEDPKQVELVVRKNDKQDLDFYVVEHGRQTDLRNDPFLTDYADDVEDGIIKPDDFVYFKSSLARLTPEHLYDAIYADRTEIQGRGVTTAYYKRLTTVATSLGYSYLTSEHFDRNIGFFTDKLGKVPITTLDQEVKTNLLNDIVTRQGALVGDEHGVVVQSLRPASA